MIWQITQLMCKGRTQIGKKYLGEKEMIIPSTTTPNMSRHCVASRIGDLVVQCAVTATHLSTNQLSTNQLSTNQLSNQPQLSMSTKQLATSQHQLSTVHLSRGWLVLRPAQV